MYFKVTKKSYSIFRAVALQKGIYKGVVKDYVIHQELLSVLDIKCQLPSSEIFEIFKKEYNKKNVLLPSFVKNGIKVSSLI